ncbi:hypothetical protein GCM10010372_26320 [Streptomyces tauricus]|nr:hypothetical protein GCM10010372_26320 [Streptomyces tauricus]
MTSPDPAELPQPPRAAVTPSADATAIRLVTRRCTTAVPNPVRPMNASARPRAQVPARAPIRSCDPKLSIRNFRSKVYTT